MPLPEYGTDNSDNFVRFIYFEIKKNSVKPPSFPKLGKYLENHCKGGDYMCVINNYIYFLIIIDLEYLVKWIKCYSDNVLKGTIKLLTNYYSKLYYIKLSLSHWLFSLCNLPLEDEMLFLSCGSLVKYQDASTHKLYKLEYLTKLILGYNRINVDNCICSIKVFAISTFERFLYHEFENNAFKLIMLHKRTSFNVYKVKTSKIALLNILEKIGRTYKRYLHTLKTPKNLTTTEVVRHG